MQKVVGYATQLEKSYFRLTAAPDPSSVRPEPVLRSALSRLNAMLASLNPPNWIYACDQYKGMRQDCTVQHLRNATAVQVYEAHARAALEYGDIAEFNQCQTQLYVMYGESTPGAVAEFTAYKILYETVHQHHPGLGRALLHTIRTAFSRPDVATSPEVAHAMAVRRAVMTSDHSSFFRLYAVAPHLARALMDLSAEKLRWSSLNVIVKAYKTQVPVSFLSAVLGFEPAAASGSVATGIGGDTLPPQPPPPSQPLPGCRERVYAGKSGASADAASGEAACCEWLTAHGALIAEDDGGVLDVKASTGRLFIPEDPKSSHGDDNLSLGDFLSAAARASQGPVML